MKPEQQIHTGLLARQGHYGDSALNLAVEICNSLESRGIETVRLLFADQHGILRGKNITARTLGSAFANGVGVPSTLLLKDTSHRTVFPVWDNCSEEAGTPLHGAGDVLIVPDPNCFYPLPWSSHSAILLCDVVHRTGEPFEYSSRYILKNAVSDVAVAGYSAIVGLEVEFQVFERLDSSLSHEQSGMPAQPVKTRNLTQGYQYLTETKYAEAEPLLDHLRRMAEGLGMLPRSMEIEMGPSQFEFTFDASDPCSQADNFVLFRTMVKEVCHARGLHATFMAKPGLPNAAANGWHIHQSLIENKTGVNVFMPEAENILTDLASGWIAGLLEHAPGACLLTNPTVNGYKRFQPHQLAPNRVQWGTDNRGAMIRALLHPADTASRIENRVADTTANPYYALASQLLAGLDGLSGGRKAPVPTHSPYADEAVQLPQSLVGAIEAFENSALFRQTPGEGFVHYLAHIKRAEWQRYLMTVSDWEQSEYFNLY